ncbi:MAG: Radical domain protein [Deltaproteobacteria bacterium]|nr:Radical domain protein [Deltaproteobacteria bacterium]
MTSAELDDADVAAFQRFADDDPARGDHRHVFQQKIDNYFLNKQEFGQRVLASTPIRLYLEATYKCNLSCTHCNRSEADLKGRQTDARMELYQQAARIVENAIEVQMHGLGEPYLARNFSEQLAFIADRGATPFACTNGQKLFPDKIRQLAESSGSFAVSIDSLVEAHGELLRPGMKVESVFRALDCAAQLRQEFPRLPMFVFSVSVKFFRDDWRPLFERLRAYAPLGWVVIPFEETGDAEFDQISLSLDEHRALVAEMQQVTDGSGVDVLSGFANEAGNCYEPWSRAFIGSNGDVRPCCRAPEDIVMGNLNDQPFDEIWNGEKYQDLRATVNTPAAWPICQDCKYRNFSANYPPPPHLIQWKLKRSGTP